jgi:hypothetical protein
MAAVADNHDAGSMSKNKIDPDQHSRIVMLAYGKMNHGGPYWCYVSVKPSQYDAFQAALATKQYNMQNFVSDGYGEVVVSGEGAKPPHDVTAKVAHMFNVPIDQLFKEADPKKLVFAKIEELREVSSLS